MNDLMNDLMEKEVDRQDRVIQGLRDENERLQARVETLEADIAECSNPCGEYYFGLRCGLEDRYITDLYEAAEYGWDQAFEYVDSILAATEQEKNDRHCCKGWSVRAVERRVAL